MPPDRMIIEALQEERKSEAQAARETAVCSCGVPDCLTPDIYTDDDPHAGQTREGTIYWPASVSGGGGSAQCRLCRRPADVIVRPAGRFPDSYHYCAGCVNDAMERAEMGQTP